MWDRIFCKVAPQKFVHVAHAKANTQPWQEASREWWLTGFGALVQTEGEEESQCSKNTDCNEGHSLG